MGELIKESSRWGQIEAQSTQTLALERAAEIQILANQGHFNNYRLTVDIEQELLLVDSQGNLLPLEEVFDVEIDRRLDPDVASSTIEFDTSNGTGPQHLTSQGLFRLFEEFSNGQQVIISEVRNFAPEAFLVSIGTHPFLKQENIKSVVVKNPDRRRRYERFQERSIAENPQKLLVIRNPISGEVFSAQAACWTIMTRCAATQIHISSESVEEALQAHNIAVAVAAPLSAIFANSPYIAGWDSGLASTRLPLTLQSEQMRSGLPKPVRSLEEYYQNQLTMSLPLFMSNEPESALRLNHGTIHTTTRIIADVDQGTIRNEYRFFDSQSPKKAIQALLLTFGITQALESASLPNYTVSTNNYLQARFGLQGQMTWNGSRIETQELCLQLIDVATNELKTHGLSEVSKEFLPQLREEVELGITPADTLRLNVQDLQQQGLSFYTAISDSLLTMK